MRYSGSLVKEILVELEKVPIARQACSKVGIDHSTFYRWMTRHPDFYCKVMIALSIGRKKINDAAESVIMTGIQNNDFRSASFWLRFNEPRYMSLNQGKQHTHIIEGILHTLDKGFDEGDYTTFDRVFEMYYELEKNYEIELVELWMKSIVDLLCIDDPKLIDVFYAAYANWKKNKNDIESKVKEIESDDE